jgi:hypothetical protein
MTSAASSAPSSTQSSSLSHNSSLHLLSDADSINSRCYSLPAKRSSTGSAIPAPRGLSSATKALAMKALSPPEQAPVITDRALLFYGGLQWLLDSTLEVTADKKNNQSSRPSLTEDAVRELGELQGQRGNRVTGLTRMDSGTRRTDAWVTGQTPP